MTLRLLIDLYFAHNLTDDGGVSRRCTWRRYERVRIGEQAQYVVWGFRGGSAWVNWNDLTGCHRRKVTKAEEKAGRNSAVDFFARQELLVSLGLLGWVPCLFESDDADSEMLHPCTHSGTDSVEDRLGAAAHRAGLALLTEQQRRHVEEQDLWLAPIPRHYSNVAMVDVAQLRYRPHTAKTAAWWAELQSKADKLLTGYRDIEAAAERKAVNY
jgi:hypothetical protein